MASPSSAHDVPRIFDRDLLRRRRDRHAALVADHTFLLDRVADDFAERIALANRTFAAALSIEALDGTLSRRLRQLANVHAMEEAEPSDALRRLCASTSTGRPRDWDHDHLGAPPEAYDLVVSGLTLQLVDDVPGALVQIARAMKPDGLLLAAMLGGESLRELREAWLIAEAEITGGASPRVAPFADVRALGGLLQRAGFALPVADTDLVTVTYPTPLHLMRELRAMGVSNMLVDRRRVPVTRRLLMRAAEVYAERHAQPDGRVRATFEIVTLTGWVPHASQQTPLAPGSAKVRLADALGVVEGKPRPDPA